MSERLAELRVSARGWHTVQLAVIGFIGLCGVLQGGRPDNPMWLQVLAGILALAALGIACVATVVVALVAWPLYGGREPVADEAVALERDGRRLKRGLALTFVALALLGLATASGWWPQDDGDGDLVRVQAGNGDSWCGPVADAGPVIAALQDVAAVERVDRC